MRKWLVIGLVLALAGCRTQAAEGIRIEKKTEVLKRAEREAVVNTPVFHGIEDPAVLETLQESIDAGVREATGSSPEEWKTEGAGWLTEIDFQTTYNAHDLLSLVYVVGGMGAYPDQMEAYVVLDLKTGRRLGAKDLFKSHEELAAKLDRMRSAAVEKALQETTGEDQAAMEPAKESRFTVENLDTFRLDDRGVTFVHDFGFPHAIQALEPSGEYFLSYEELRPYVNPQGPLSRILG